MSLNGKPVEKTTIIACLECGFEGKVSDFQVVNGSSISKSDGPGVWQTRYFYCICSKKHVKVYDPGDKQLEIPPHAKARVVEAAQ